MSSKSILHTYEIIRKEYFPSWDRAGLWKCKIVPQSNSNQGKCCKESKTIKIVESPEQQSELYYSCLIIHEICHAFGSGHGKQWLARMEKAAEHAEKISQLELANDLRKEITHYKNTPLITAKDVYNDIDEPLQVNCNASLDDVADWIADNYGISKEELFKRYKRFKVEFTKRQKYYQKQSEYDL